MSANLLSSKGLASIGIFVSVLTLAGIVFFVPLLVHRANQLRAEVEEKSARFKQSSDRVWQKLITVERVREDDNKGPAVVFSRKPRSPWNQHICQGCHSLTCQAGLPGSAGPAGPDGEPGEPGKQGFPGEDGFDVQLQPEADLPCVICPAGPPGLRGSQGERGRIGEQGTSGEEGPAGKQGRDGPPGRFGQPGNPGKSGSMGHPGPPGDQVIAGVGIKGPQGPPGSAGPKGPQGAPGKASRDVGMPGKPGPGGPPGPPGNPGPAGETGGFGTPGDHGEPASYCPSDCGVSHIKAPGFAAEEPVQDTSYGKEKATTEAYRRWVQRR